MHCSASAESRPCSAPGGPGLAAALLALWVIAVSVPAHAAPGFKVRSATTELADGVHRLDARIDFDFSPEAIDAMENGVALTVAIQMQVLRLARLWDRPVAEVYARYRIQAHALSRQYLVKNLSTGETNTYRDFGEMSEHIGRLSQYPLLDDHLLEDDEAYRVRVRAILDLESLPTPLRLLAYLRSAWDLSSDWITWPLER